MANNTISLSDGCNISTFPSPCGVNIVANDKGEEPPEEDPDVSVPLRGKYRGEFQSQVSLCCGVVRGVSVPLRGKYRGEY